MFDLSWVKGEIKLNSIKQEMINRGADGVIFHPICAKNIDIFKNMHCEYTLNEIDNIKAFPKSGRSYYKLINGKKILLK